MYQKDYILRMIGMLGDLIAGILGRIKKGDFQKASEELTNIYYDMLREDAAFFREIPEGELTNTLLHEHNYTNGHLEILAELFNAEAELCQAQGNIAPTIEYSKKSLKLFEFIDTEGRTYSQDRIDKMQLILGRISNLQNN
jgi:hypothetical protein